MLTVRETPEFIPLKKMAILGPEKTVHDACVEMVAKDNSCVVILDKKEILGIFAEQDLMKRVLAKGLDPKKTILKDVMTTKIITFKDYEHQSKALDLMIEGDFRHIPIVDVEGTLVGILGLKHYLKANLSGLFSRARRHSLIEFCKSPSFYMMIFAVLLYSMILMWFTTSI